MKTAIITDSTSYIPETLRKEWNIYMIPLNVVIGGESFKEEMDITAEQFYEEVQNEQKLPTTSQPSIGQFVELFEDLSKEYDAAICILLSSGISGTYQTSVAAGKMVDGLEVFSYDSEISCAAQGFYVMAASRLAREGMEPQNILKKLDELKATLRAYFMVDDLDHLKRGGRLSGAQAFVGNLLQVKPLLHFENKVIVPFEKIRTKKRALKRIEQLFSEDYQKGIPLQAAIIHANRPREASDWMEELKNQYPETEFQISYFGPVIGTHLGEGALGMTWAKKLF